MGIIKKIFGCVLFLLGCSSIVNGFINAPLCNGLYEMIGFMGGGILFGLIFLHFGWKWIRG